MSSLLRIAPWPIAFFISAVFLDSLRFKFTGHPTPEHIFTTLRDWSGIGLFFPAGPWIIGLAELASSLLLLVAPAILFFARKQRLGEASQALGALIAIGVMSGAIIFHLFTPLGVETPVTWENGQPTSYSPALFIAACFSWVGAAIILFLRREVVQRHGALAPA